MADSWVPDPGVNELFWVPTAAVELRSRVLSVAAEFLTVLGAGEGQAHDTPAAPQSFDNSQERRSLGEAGNSGGYSFAGGPGTRLAIAAVSASGGDCEGEWEVDSRAG